MTALQQNKPPLGQTELLYFLHQVVLPQTVRADWYLFILPACLHRQHATLRNKPGGLLASVLLVPAVLRVLAARVILTHDN